MIRKLIYIGVSALSIYLTYTLVVSGFSSRLNLPFNTNVLAYNEIISKGEELNRKISRVNTLNSAEIASARNSVETEKANFEAQKNDYTDLEANASEEEIAEANKKQEYLLDYLWIVIGNYANDNNVKFKMTIDDVNLRINFDITGSYVSIINFIYDIENDSNLKFNLNGIEMASSTSENTTKASFSVDGITVKTSTTPET